MNIRRLLAVLLLCWVCGCAGVPQRPAVVPEPAPQPVAPPTRPAVGLIKVPADQIPPLADDMDPESLALAIDRSLQYLDRIKEQRTFRFGDDRYTLREMKDSLLSFQEILRTTAEPAEREAKIRDTFEFYKSPGRNTDGRVLFTGYFEPVLEGSLKKEDAYQHPIYRIPDDLITIDLGKFKSKYRGERLVGRVSNRELLPYYNRKEITLDGSLENKGLELVWLADPIDSFFLHIQGSGVVRLPNGRQMQIGYAEANGRPYRSIARYLLDSGKIAQKESSHRYIKQYLREHPEEMDDILNQNESYVFFRIVDKGPIGSLGVTITGGRSIATDPEFFPKAALSFIRLRKPVFDEAGTLQAWTDFSRFTLNQDTGGVIKGTGRVDIFCGRGEPAEQIAGSFKEQGDLYFLIKKKQDFP